MNVEDNMNIVSKMPSLKHKTFENYSAYGIFANIYRKA